MDFIEKELKEIIKRDDTRRFRSVLYGKNGDIKIEGYFLTQFCAISDSPGCMAISIEIGSPVNVFDESMSPLNYSSISGSVETACLLIEAGADVNHISNGETPLMQAVRYSTPEHVQMLIESGAQSIDVVYAAKYSRSKDVLRHFINNGDKEKALEAAVQAGKSDNVELLIEVGAQANHSLLVLACSINNPRIVTNIISSGVKPDDLAVQTCIFWNSIDSMNALFGLGINPTPLHLHYSVFHNKPQCLSNLIERGVEIHSPINGTFPIHIAARHGRNECLKLLVERGAKLNCTDSFGCTPLHWASLRKKTDTLDLLLSYGAIVNIDDPTLFEPSLEPPISGWSAIHVALDGKCNDSSLKLIEAGAKQAKMWDGRTPLHMAYKNCNDDVVSKLLDNGADQNERNRNEQTPLEYAMAIGRINKTKSMDSSSTPKKTLGNNTPKTELAIQFDDTKNDQLDQDLEDILRDIDINDVNLDELLEGELDVDLADLEEDL